MTTTITGGAPANPLVQPVTDADMAAIQTLKNAGVGEGEGPLTESAFRAIVALRSGPSSRGEKYKAWMERVQAARHDPRGSRLWESQNREMVRSLRRFTPQDALLGSTTVHTNATLAELSIQYGNDDFIGLELMPAILTPKKSDTFYTYNKADRFKGPSSDEVGDYGDAVEIEEGRGTDTYACVPRATKKKIAASTIANEDAPLDEMMDLGEAVAEVRALRREIRIAAVVLAAANYATANKATLAGADQWNSATGGNPIKNMHTADAALFRGRGPADTVAFSGLSEYQVLSRHADILGLFIYGGASPGLATPDMIARLVGWDRYLVGRARQDTATEGDASVYARIWDGFFGVVRVMRRPSIRNVAFGVTMRWTAPGMLGSNGGIVTKQWYDPTQGFGGTYWHEQGEAEHHKALCNDAGYLFTSPIA